MKSESGWTQEQRKLFWRNNSTQSHHRLLALAWLLVAAACIVAFAGCNLSNAIMYDYVKPYLIDPITTTICPKPTPKVVEKPVYVYVQVTPTPEPPRPLNIAPGIDYYRNFEYEKGLRYLEQELSWANPQCLGYLEALVYAGACAYMIRKESLAAEYFRRVQAMDQDYQIDAKDFSPEIHLFYRRSLR